MSREAMDFDVVIVGAGPSGLATSIRLAQLAEEKNQELNICIIDKGSSIGAHILSGAVLEPKSLNELFPDWQKQNPPSFTPVAKDKFMLLTKSKAWRLPTPPQMKNHGNMIISLGQYTAWLAEKAESMEINVFPGFAAAEILYEDDRVVGVATGVMGLDKNGERKDSFEEGVELRAKQVIFAEGCRGSLTKQIMQRYDLNKDADPQTYGLGLKEIWEVPEECHEKGLVTHTIGWPLDNSTYGGSFMYHFDNNKVSIGFVVGLDYKNTFLSPFKEFQRFKEHPSIRPILENGRRLAYGARTLIEGGLQSLPKLTFPGGMIVGDAAGFLNVPKIKGINNAIKSGILAAESIFPTLQDDKPSECTTYTQAVKDSWLWEDLYKVRNVRPALSWGLWPGLAYSAIDSYVFFGRAPWTLHHKHSDNECTEKTINCKPINYPKPDGKVSFDLPSSVYLTRTHHDENEPCHLKLTNPAIAIDINYKEYDSPEQRYCPAGVYEVLHEENNQPRLQINAPNCIHCKACDIKDPTQNINWTTPEGSDGPQYEMM